MEVAPQPKKLNPPFVKTKGDQIKWGVDSAPSIDFFDLFLIHHLGISVDLRLTKLVGGHVQYYL